MNVNGVTNTIDAYSTYAADSSKKKEESVANESANTNDVAAVYEASKETDTVKASGKNKIANPEMFAKLKADAEARTEQLRQIVEQLMSKQADTFGKATDIWGFLREGNFTVDAATKAQAQEDISEDGYWGVNQTSDRIIDFAKALAGDDPAKLNDMMEAFKKGYKQAEKTWGGELPEISKKTYDAVLDKFDKLINGTNE